MSRLVLDAGALIALDRGDRVMWARMAKAYADGTSVVTHGGVIAQAWRTSRQARLARAMRAIDVVSLDRELGKLTGLLLAAARAKDAIDGALVVVSRDGDRIFTSDPDDLVPLAAAAGRDVEIVQV